MSLEAIRIQEISSLQNQLTEVMKHIPGGHFCFEWDGLFVTPDMPEFQVCICPEKSSTITNARRLKMYESRHVSFLEFSNKLTRCYVFNPDICNWVLFGSGHNKREACNSGIQVIDAIEAQSCDH